MKKLKFWKNGDIILHKCAINDNHMIDIWFLIYEAWQKEFLVILDHFLPFYLPH